MLEAFHMAAPATAEAKKNFIIGLVTTAWAGGMITGGL